MLRCRYVQTQRRWLCYLYSCPPDDHACWQRHARSSPDTSTEKNIQGVLHHCMRTTCWPDHQHLRPANYHTVHFARSSRVAMSSIALPAETRPFRSHNQWDMCLRGDGVLTRVAACSRLLVGHINIPACPQLQSVEDLSAANQLEHPQAGCHATSICWRLLCQPAWWNVVYQHATTQSDNSQDLKHPKTSTLTHLRVLPVTLLMLAATLSMLKCSPTTAGAPGVSTSLWGFG